MPETIMENVLVGVSNALAPLSMVNSADAAYGFLKKLGYELPNPQSLASFPAGLLSKVEGLVHQVDALMNASNDGNRLPAALALGNTVKDIVVDVSNLINSLQSAATNAGDFFRSAPVNELPRRLIDYIIATYIESYYSGPYSFLLLIGIFDEVPLNADSAIHQPACTLKKVWWERLPKYLTQPQSIAHEIYNWNADFNSDLFLTRLERIIRGFILPGGIYNQSTGLSNPDGQAKEIRIPIFQAGKTLDLYSQFGLLIAPAAANGHPKGLALVPYFSGTGKMALSMSEQFEIALESSGSLENGLGIILRPPAQLELLDNLFATPASAGTFRLRLSIRKKTAQQPEIILFGAADGTRISLKGSELIIFVSKNGNSFDYGVEFGIREVKLVISTDNADGFIKQILSGFQIELTFDFGIGWSAQSGVYFNASGALEVNIAIHLELGPVRIDNLYLALKPENKSFPLTAAIDFDFSLGPIRAVAQNIGLIATLGFPDGGGNMGVADFAPGFKPPNGIALSIDTGIIKGGGFLRFEPDKGEYSGALELSIKNTIQVAAIGIINTKMPDGTEGFSLLIILSVQFTPGIVLGMGFFLGGLGGMLGINRTISVPALREGVRNNTLDSILFPEDVVANINTLLPQIRQIFPIQRDQFFIGLMAKITWGIPTLISIEFGIAIEFSNPTRIAILGILKIVLPTEDAAILRLQVNFLGVIDFDNGYLSFDANIVNSRILMFTLAGDMALRLNWGRTKGFLISVGGFHPSFTPPQELNVPSLRRLTLSIFSGNPYLVLTCYFAVTSNTVQFGARLDLRFEVGWFSVVGFMVFDVLFQFSPFRFEVHVGAGLAVKCGTATLFSIELDLVLAGPTPWNAKGTASFSILFITIKVRFNITWGDAQQISEPSIAVLPKALEAFNLGANWVAEIPTNRTNLVSLKDLKATGDQIVLQSYGALKVSQTVVPLNMDINKFGNNVPLDVKQFRIGAFSIGGQLLAKQEVRDAFAPAAFLKMEDEDKLKAPSYTQEVSGVKGADSDVLHVIYGINRQLAYDCTISDFDQFPNKLPDFVPFNMSIFKLLTRGGDIGKNPLSKEYKSKAFKKEDGAVSIAEETFVIVNNSTLAQYARRAFSGGSQAEAQSALNNILHNNPELRNSISITPAYHMETV